MLKRTRLSFYYRRATRLVASAVILSLLTAVPASGQTRDHAHEDHGAADSLSWRVPPIHDMTLPMMPSLVGLTPPEDPWLPGIGIDPASFPEAVPGEVAELEDGDTLRITAMRVRRTIRGQTLVMYGFNGQYPGPLIKVDKDATIYVDFTNEIEQPTTIHWHGVRLDNRFDGVPEVTQEPVPPRPGWLARRRRDGWPLAHRGAILTDSAIPGGSTTTAGDTFHDRSSQE